MGRSGLGVGRLVAAFVTTVVAAATLTTTVGGPAHAASPTLAAAGSAVSEVTMDLVLGAAGQYDVHAAQSTPLTVPGDSTCASTTYGTPAPPGGRLAPSDADAGRDALRASASTGCVDIARSELGPRPTAADGDRASFEYYAYALDDVTWASPSLQAPPAMTIAQLRGVFACTITDWSQLPGGGSGQIQRVFPPLDSGTGATFVSNVLGGVEPVAGGPDCPPIVRADENRGVPDDQPDLARVYQQAIMPYSAARWVYQANNWANPSLDDRGGARIGGIIPTGSSTASFPVFSSTPGTYRLDPKVVTESNANLLDPHDTSALPGVHYVYNVIDSSSPGYAAARGLVGFDVQAATTPATPLCNGTKRSSILSSGLLGLSPATVGAATHTTCRMPGLTAAIDAPGTTPPVVTNPPAPPTTNAPPTTTPSGPVGGGDRVLLGVYKWSYPPAVDAYSQWIGRSVDLAMDFMPSSSKSCETNWSSIDGNATILDQWAKWVKAAPGRNMVFGVPMLSPIQPGNQSIGCWTVDTAAIATELRAGASGAYDAHFRALAQNLVTRGLGRSKLRLGWEAGGNWYRDQFGPDVAAWKTFYRQIVTTMRSVPGANFEFVFNAGMASWTRDPSGRVVPVTEAWPGDDVVDTIGFDVYCNNNSWTDVLNGTGSQGGASNLGQGLTYWAQFAAVHGKRMAFPEWGVLNATSCGDNNGGPAFVQGMHDWMAAHDVAWHVYFDVDPSCSYIVGATNSCAVVEAGADSQLMPAADPRVATHHPQTSDLYKRLFSLPLSSSP